MSMTRNDAIERINGAAKIYGQVPEEVLSCFKDIIERCDESDISTIVARIEDEYKAKQEETKEKTKEEKEKAKEYINQLGTAKKILEKSKDNLKEISRNKISDAVCILENRINHIKKLKAIEEFYSLLSTFKINMTQIGEFLSSRDPQTQLNTAKKVKTESIAGAANTTVALAQAATEVVNNRWKISIDKHDQKFLETLGECYKSLAESLPRLDDLATLNLDSTDEEIENKLHVIKAFLTNVSTDKILSLFTYLCNTIERATALFTKLKKENTDAFYVFNEILTSYVNLPQIMPVKFTLFIADIKKGTSILTEELSTKLGLEIDNTVNLYHVRKQLLEIEKYKNKLTHRQNNLFWMGRRTRVDEKIKICDEISGILKPPYEDWKKKREQIEKINTDIRKKGTSIIKFKNAILNELKNMKDTGMPITIPEDALNNIKLVDYLIEHDIRLSPAQIERLNKECIDLKSADDFKRFLDEHYGIKLSDKDAAIIYRHNNFNYADNLKNDRLKNYVFKKNIRLTEEQVHKLNAFCNGPTLSNKKFRAALNECGINTKYINRYTTAEWNNENNYCYEADAPQVFYRSPLHPLPTQTTERVESNTLDYDHYQSKLNLVYAALRPVIDIDIGLPAGWRDISSDQERNLYLYRTFEYKKGAGNPEMDKLCGSDGTLVVKIHDEDAYDLIKTEDFVARCRLMADGAKWLVDNNEPWQSLSADTKANIKAMLDAINGIHADKIKAECVIDPALIQGDDHHARIKHVKEMHAKFQKLNAQALSDIAYYLKKTAMGPAVPSTGLGPQHIIKLLEDAEKHAIKEKGRPNIIKIGYVGRQQMVSAQFCGGEETYPSSIRSRNIGDKTYLSNHVIDVTGHIDGNEIVCDTIIAGHSSYPPISESDELKRRYITYLAAKEKLAKTAADIKAASNNPKLGNKENPISISQATIMLVSPLFSSALEDLVKPKIEDNETRQVSDSALALTMLAHEGMPVKLTIGEQTLYVNVNTSLINLPTNIGSKSYQGFGKLALQSQTGSAVNAKGFYEYCQAIEKKLQELSPADMNATFNKLKSPKLNLIEKKIQNILDTLTPVLNAKYQELQKILERYNSEKHDDVKKIIRSQYNIVLKEIEKIESSIPYADFIKEKLSLIKNVNFAALYEKIKADKTPYALLQRRFIEAQEIFLTTKNIDDSKYKYIFHTLYLLTQQQAGMTIEAFCKSGKDRTGYLRISVLAYQAFHLENGRDPNFANDNDLKQFNDLIAKQAMPLSASLETTHYNAVARGFIIEPTLTIPEMEASRLMGKLAKSVFKGNIDTVIPSPWLQRMPDDTRTSMLRLFLQYPEQFHDENKQTACINAYESLSLKEFRELIPTIKAGLNNAPESRIKDNLITHLKDIDELDKKKTQLEALESARKRWEEFAKRVNALGPVIDRVCGQKVITGPGLFVGRNGIAAAAPDDKHKLVK